LFITLERGEMFIASCKMGDAFGSGAEAMTWNSGAGGGKVLYAVEGTLAAVGAGHAFGEAYFSRGKIPASG
jgi:hypothetical protein